MRPVLLAAIIYAFSSLFQQCLSIHHQGCNVSEIELIGQASAEASYILSVVLATRRTGTSTWGKLDYEQVKSIDHKYFGEQHDGEKAEMFELLSKAKLYLDDPKLICDSEYETNDTPAATAPNIDNYIRIYTPFYDLTASAEDMDRLKSNFFSARPFVLIHETLHLSKWLCMDRFIDDLPLSNECFEHSESHPGCVTAYGPINAQCVAHHSPELALHNADNYVCYVVQVYLGLRFGLVGGDQDHTDDDLPDALHNWLRMLDMGDHTLLSKVFYDKPLEELLSKGVYGKGLMPHCSDVVDGRDEL